MRIFKILFISLFYFFGNSVFSQNFEIKPNYLSETTDSAIYDFVLHSKVLVKIPRTLNMRWLRVDDVDRTKWENAICVKITCYAPSVDSSDFTIDQIQDSAGVRLDAHFRANKMVRSDSVKLMVFEINARDKAQFVTYVYSLKTTGIVENKTKSVLKKAYPNPVKDNFFIELEEGNYITNVEIYSAKGIKFHSFNPLQNSCNLNLSFLNPGSYLIKITDIKNQTIIKPIIKY